MYVYVEGAQQRMCVSCKEGRAGEKEERGRRGEGERGGEMVEAYLGILWVQAGLNCRCQLDNKNYPTVASS